MKMKKLIGPIFILVFCLSFFKDSFVFANDEDKNTTEPAISAQSAYLIDNRTNKVLFQKNSDKKMYPASTTKILTAILTLENCNVDDPVTASFDAVNSIPDGYSTANIQVGETLTVGQLLEVLLIHSANDSANILAEHVGGSVDSFVTMMNTKANEIGLNSSHFTNAYGKHDDNHYTTAHDLAILMKYCLKNDTFRKISGKASCAIPATNMSGTRTYTSTNELAIPKTRNYYPYLTSGKTGFTTQAKECLVSASYKDDLELICVVLGSTSRFNDTKNLFEFGYSNYCVKTIANERDVVSNITVSNATKDTKSLDLVLYEPISALMKTSDSLEDLKPEISLNDKISAPISENDVLGKATYSINGVTYTTNVVASHSVEKSNFWTYMIYGFMFFVFLLLIYECFFNKKKRIKKSKKVKYYYGR